MHTQMSMLEEWRQTKVNIVTLTTSTFPNFKTLIFLVSHLCNIYLDFCFDHFITLFSGLNRLTMGAKVEFVYNLLNIVRNYITPFNEHKNLHFNNIKDVQVSSKIYHKNGDMHNLDMLTILCKSHVSYPRRSGVVGKSNHLRPIHH